MNITVLDDYQNAFRTLGCYTRLNDHAVTVYHDTERNPERLAARLAGADAVIVTGQRSQFSRAVVERLPSSLKLIAQTGRHFEHIDLDACTAQGIVVSLPKPRSDIRGANGSSTVELAWGLIIASLRHIPEEIRKLKQGLWQSAIGTNLDGLSLGIYALGNIGNRMAKVGAAFGMTVTVWGREGSREKARSAGYEVPSSREAFFESADVLTLHLPLRPETSGIVTADDLLRMKPTALLVNTSRAGLIAPGALVHALKQGRPGYAAVDVFEEEPIIGGDHPLLKMPNVICTPHIGYVVQNTFENFYGTVIESILSFAQGKPTGVLNPQVLNKR